jgi:large subunit ribosomal protein L32
MAVPKKKQSHSRTAKRRAQHKISAPALNACPQCHSPRRPHRVCPVCGFYAGREVVGAPPAPAGDAAHEHDAE